MRHRKKSEKFSRSRAQRKALVKSLLRSLVTSYRIRTTTSKAKGIRGPMDRLITLAKKGDIHSRRRAYDVLGSHQLVKKLFMDIAPHFKEVSGGYTKVIDIGYRRGDGAPISIVELTRIERSTKLFKKKSSAAEKHDAAAEKETKRPASASTQQRGGFAAGVKKIFKKERGSR